MSPEIFRGRSVSLPLAASKYHLLTWFVTPLLPTFYKNYDGTGNVAQLMNVHPAYIKSWVLFLAPHTTGCDDHSPWEAEVGGS